MKLRLNPVVFSLFNSCALPQSSPFRAGGRKQSWLRSGAISPSLPPFSLQGRGLVNLFPAVRRADYLHWRTVTAIGAAQNGRMAPFQDRHGLPLPGSSWHRGIGQRHEYLPAARRHPPLSGPRYRARYPIPSEQAEEFRLRMPVKFFNIDYCASISTMWLPSVRSAVCARSSTG